MAERVGYKIIRDKKVLEDAYKANELYDSVQGWMVLTENVLGDIDSSYHPLLRETIATVLVEKIKEDADEFRNITGSAVPLKGDIEISNIVKASLKKRFEQEKIDRIKRAVEAISLAEHNLHNEKLIEQRAKEIERIRKVTSERFGPGTTAEPQISAREAAIIGLEKEREQAGHLYDLLLRIVRTPSSGQDISDPKPETSPSGA